MYRKIDEKTLATVSDALAKVISNAFGKQFFTPYMHALVRHGIEIRRRNGGSLAGVNAAWQFESCYGKVARLFETCSRNTTKAALQNHLISYLDSHHEAEGCKAHPVVIPGRPKSGSKSCDAYFFTFDEDRWTYRYVVLLTHSQFRFP